MKKYLQSQWFRHALTGKFIKTYCYSKRGSDLTTNDHEDFMERIKDKIDSGGRFIDYSNFKYELPIEFLL